MKRPSIWPEDGWFGALTRDQAPGAIANGTRIVKAESEPGDTNPVGTRGVVLGSIDVSDIALPELKRPAEQFVYFVEWDSLPRHAFFMVDWKIRPVRRQ